MCAQTAQRRSTYGVFIMLVQTIKMKSKCQKTVTTLDVFVACDHCITCWYDGKTFVQSAAHNVIGLALHDISACSSSFVSLCLAKRYKIQALIFIIKSLIRNKTWSKCI
jgi:hypothetical protein